MDPLSVTLAVVSFASFLKDIVELGLIIKATIDKVGWNRKRLHVLASDVVYGLENLEMYYRKHEYNLDLSAELKTALRRLHSELLLVRDRCQQIFPTARGSRFSLFRANVKAWTRRDDIEADIVRLKDHINGCYLQFIAFTSARIEHKLIVHRVEDQVRLTRMEGLFTRWLVETHANHSSTNQIFGSTTTINLGRDNIEYQFLRLQIKRIVDLSANVVAFGMVTEESMNLSPGPLVTLPAIPRSDDEAGHLQEIFMAASQMLCFLRDNTSGVSIQDWADQMSSFASSLYDFGMPDVALGTLVVNSYQILVKHNAESFMPYLASALHRSSNYHAFAGEMEGSSAAIKDSLAIYRLLHDTNPNQAYKMSLARTLRGFSSSISDEDVALASARESLNMLRALALEMKPMSSARRMSDVNNELGISRFVKQRKGNTGFSWPSTGNPLAVSYETASALRRLSCCLAISGSFDEAYAAQKESLDILLSLASKCPDTFHVDLADTQFGIYFCLSRIGKMQDALSALEKAVVSYRLLGQRRPLKFTITFINTLSLYASHLHDVGRDDKVPAIREEAVNAFQKLVHGSGSAIGPDVFKDVSSHLMALGRHDEAISITKESVDVCRLRFQNASQTEPSLASDLTEFIDAISTYTALIRDLERESEALAVEEEALHAFRKFVDCYPDQVCRLPNIFLEVLPHLLALGRYDEAIAIADEGLEIYHFHLRNIPESAPSIEVAVERYINALSAFSTLLQDVGRDNKALAVGEEARQTFQKIYNCCPDQARYLLDVFRTHSFHLRKLGRHEEAIAITKEVTDIYRLRICGIPETAQSLQVTSGMCEFIEILSAFATLLQDIGRDSEALAVEEEALQAFRRFVNHCPDQALDLPNVFVNLSSRLRLIGRHEDAMTIAKEGLDIYRLRFRNTTESPACDLEAPIGIEKFVDALCIFITLLQDFGRDSEVPAAEEEALDAFRNIVNYHPDMALYFLQNVLLRLPSHLLTLGRYDEAVAIAKESLDIYRPLICDPPWMKLFFASNLVDFALSLCWAQQWADSLAFKREAVEVYRSISAGNPHLTAAFMEALRCFAIDLDEAGDVDGTLSACEEAFEVHRGLVGESLPSEPETHALVQLTRADTFYHMGQYSEALAASEAATALVSTAPNEVLGRVLSCFSDCLLAVGRVQDALAASEEAMKNFQDLDMQLPGRLACARNAYSRSLAILGHKTEALAAAEEATSLCRKVHRENPCTYGAFDHNLATIILNFSICLAATGGLNDALANNAEAVEIYSKIVSTRPGFYPELANALHSLSIRLSEAGRQEEAIMNNLEAVEIYRKAVVTRPGRSPELTQALHSLSILLWKADRREEAVDACLEIVDIHQRLVMTDPDSAHLLNEAQDNLAARVSDMVQLVELSAGTAQNPIPYGENPAITMNSTLQLKEDDIERDVEMETGSNKRNAFDTSSRLEKTTLGALTIPNEDGNAKQMIHADMRGVQTSNDSLMNAGLIGLTDFISSISIPKLVWDHLSG